MKNILTTILLIGCTQICCAQTINWNSRKENDQMLSARVGWEYGLAYSAAYSYHKDLFQLPAFTTIEYSMPSGNKFTDDFKVSMHEQMRFWQRNEFILSGKIGLSLRRYENPNVRLINMGSELEVAFGYYKDRWFAGAEIAWDKAWATNFEHSSEFEASFPGIKNGWANSTTGGNVTMGIRTGISFNKNDVFLHAGMARTEAFNTTPYIPYYLKVGFNRRW